MVQQAATIGIETTFEKPLADTEDAVREALSAEGFGVLTEIDVAATLRAKLGVERRALKILGACNPNFAHQALELDPSVALALPCNVVLEDAGEGRTHVVIADPRSMLGGSAASPGLVALGAEAAAALQRVLDQLEG